ncbi:Retrovirus-related Pol polyprotein from transposon TNT 1-94 [Gossypium australe]|uniref:Retrovirus-related Pol polyprotein from transposon TNT 1-94 n=1 Tax=Gossypium australe TaxID=47621 RepID=A0A5B6V910_9ROSI|nr:Retrovirus-related Pol polyprotein from transposon TNT 1-94 [Gossypium australe]
MASNGKNPTAQPIIPIFKVNTSKKAWEILKQDYLADKKVAIVKLQTLSFDFETLIMQEFLSRVSGIVNQMRSYGQILSNEIAVIKDLYTYAFDILMSSLIVHEARISKSHEKFEEKAFQVKDDSSKGRGEFYGRVVAVAEEEANMREEQQKQENFTENVEEECKLIMAYSPIIQYDNNKQDKTKVQLGDNKQMKVEEKGTIGIKTVQGDVKLLFNVQFVPSLVHNLFSIGHLLM